MGLIKGQIFHLPINRGGRGINDLSNAAIKSGLKDIQSSQGVDLMSFERIDNRGPYPRLCRQVEDTFCAFKRPLDQTAVPDIPLQQSEIPPFHKPGYIAPLYPWIIVIIEAVQAQDIMPIIDKSLHQVRSDKARPASDNDQDLLSLIKIPELLQIYKDSRIAANGKPRL
jgi:hypothetical protein